MTTTGCRGCGSGCTAVDFLLHSGEPLKELRAIAELPGMGHRILVHGGDDRRRTADGIDILTVRAFLDLVENGALV